MAIIRLRELKEMGSKELEDKLAEVGKEIHLEAGATANTGKPNNPGKYRELKKVRARINTLLGERQRKTAQPRGKETAVVKAVKKEADKTANPQPKEEKKKEA